MSLDSNTVIGNASEIIDLFGGIRPMSTKTGIPVTTIQGWKQRNAIPSSRKTELIDAANRHGIMLGSLLMDIAGDKDIINSIDDVSFEEEKIVQKEKIHVASLDPELRPASNQAVLIAAGALILAAAVGGTFIAVAPKFKEVSAQDIRIRQLEDQIAQIQQAQQEVEKEQPQQNTNQAALNMPSINMPNIPMPQPLIEAKAKIDVLEGKVDQLTNQAQSIGIAVDNFTNGKISERLNKVENIVLQTKYIVLQNLTLRLNALQASAEGALQMQSIKSKIVAALPADAAPENISSTVVALKTSDPQVNEMFKDVAPEDMGTAVMLLGLTQLRHALTVDNQPFDQDLQLLKITAARDNPELQGAIDQLVPYAKTGILTPSGLSQYLRTETPAILAVSLTGQDVSAKDKAMAQLGSIIKVEKNGQQISGTPTQIALADAQKKLDAGDVAGAVSALQHITGPAAEKTESIIVKSQVALLATHVQGLISREISKILKGETTQAAPQPQPEPQPTAQTGDQP